MTPSRRNVTLFGAGFVALALALASRGGAPDRNGGTPTVLVRRNALEVVLVEPGTLAAARAVTLSSKIRSNRATIASILPEGTRVEAGDVVVSFDVTPFEEALEARSGELREAESATVRAVQERKLQIARAEEALESARHMAKLARLHLEAFEGGSGALSVREAEVRAEDTGSALARERAKLADMETMLERGFVSEGEIARQRDRVEEMERQSGLERDRLRAARDVVFPRDLERARSEAQDSQAAVTRAEQVLFHTHEFYSAAVEAAKSRAARAREAVAAAREELAHTKLTAPIDGFVLLENIPLDGTRRKPQVGDSVWSGQAIATIPDLSQLVVYTRVREVDLHRVREGLRAIVDVEAYPDLVLGGRIEFIGSLANDSNDSAWKYFDVRLLLDRTDERLRPGMSGRVSYRLGRVKNALVIPIDAVFPRRDRQVVYVRRGGETWEREVRLGLRNATHVAVTEGLSAGEELLLDAPGGAVRRERSARPDA